MRVQGHEDSVVACAWHPTSERIVSASLDASLRVWATGSRQCLQVLGLSPW